MSGREVLTGPSPHQDSVHSSDNESFLIFDEPQTGDQSHDIQLLNLQQLIIIIIKKKKNNNNNNDDNNNNNINNNNNYNNNNYNNNNNRIHVLSYQVRGTMVHHSPLTSVHRPTVVQCSSPVPVQWPPVN